MIQSICKLGQIVLEHGEQTRIIDGTVFVRQHVSKPDDAAPRDLRQRITAFGRNPPRRFTDDFQHPFDSITGTYIVQKVVEGEFIREFERLAGRFPHIPQVRGVTLVRRNYSAYPLIRANSALEVLIYICKLRASALI